ncbi:MAG: exodeoxyribonuclease V subunit gamma, partial [Nitriliruptorales bacterium]
APGETDRRPVLDPDDRSIQIHACHGRTRQVEVLRDAILHLLADSPDLEPRDIVVMCPDIETFAPIVHAVFGADAVVEDDDDGEMGVGLPDLRVRLADRSLRRTNPVLRVIAEFLDLADGRLTASEVLDLASREPVRRRFGFADDDLERLEAWVAEAGIRWGLDATHRGAYGLDGIDANTWRRGLDRILVGATMADEDERLVGGTVPLDDVEGGGVGLAGRLAELLARIAAAVESLRGPCTIDAWAAAVRAVADGLTATSELSGWQRSQLDRVLADVVAEASRDGAVSEVVLALDEVRALLDDRLRGRPTRANHRTGDLTVCTLVPMRSVPHRVVCLLGLDDGAFPRKTVPDGDDLVDGDPRVGDRDGRTEDRQLLLDAVLAAKDTLVVTYTGRDERTNEELAPAVPIGELLDTVDATVRTQNEAQPGREQVVVRHPLQPSDPRNFTPGEPLPDRPWGFDPTALAGAKARAAGTVEAPAFLAARPPAPAGEDTIELDDLVRFLEHPCKSLLRRRLGVTLPRRSEEPSDAIPVELGGLEKFAIGDRMLTARLAGADLERLDAVERARGTLPPGELADAVLDEVRTTVEQLAAAAAARF